MRRPITMPTAIGILLLLGGVALGIFGVRQGKEVVLKATSDEKPIDVRVTNVRENSLTISWITESPVGGYVNFQEVGGDEKVERDIRDAGGTTLGKFTTHYVDVVDLKPETYYEFRLVSGKIIYDNNGGPYKVLTPADLEEKPLANDIVEGVVLNETKAANGAIVYFDLDRLAPLSAIVKSTGTYNIPLSAARTRDLRGQYNGPIDGEIFNLFIYGEGSGQATARVNIKNRDLVPEIVIGHDYDFTGELPRDLSGEIIVPTSAPVINLSSPSPAEVMESKFSFVNLPSPVPQEGIEITFPEPLAQTTDTTPEISGKAPPSKSLTLTIVTDQQSGVITADNTGTWKWIPPRELAAGEQTVTLSFIDSSGRLQKLVRKFIIVE